MKICVVLGRIVNAGWSTTHSWTVRVPRKVRRLRHNPRNWPHVEKCAVKSAFFQGFLLLARQMLGEVGLPRKARCGA